MIDVILGSDIYSQILLQELRKGFSTAQQTSLGWILMGPVEKNNQTIKVNTLIVNDDLNKQIKRSWELKNIPVKQLLSTEDEMCEKIYQEGIERRSPGRIW